MPTRRSLVTPARAECLDEVLTAGEHVAAAVTWDFYREIVAADDEPVRRAGKTRMVKLVKQTRTGVAQGLTTLATLGWTL